MVEDTKATGMGEIRLVYLSRDEFDEGAAHRGGALLIDGKGTPLEFRCTSPVRPNAVQRTLYGESLEPYMLVELIGKPLLSSLRKTYELVLVDDPRFLNLSAHVSEPMVYLRRQGAAMAPASGQGEQSASSLLDSPNGAFQPVVIETFPTDRVALESAMPMIEEAAKALDPLEPFDRVKRALQRVHEEKVFEG